MREPTFALVVLGYVRVTGCEEVTVPAGTFVAVRLDVAASVPSVPGMYQNATYWYAPAVKNKVKQSVAAGPFQKAFVSYELEAFTIDVRKPATQ